MIKFLKNNKLKGFLPLFFLLAFGACKKESSDIGYALLKDNALDDAEKVTFTQAICRSVLDDSVRSDILSSGLFGMINDPVLGGSKVSLIIQPSVSEISIDSSIRNSDSTKLILKYDIAEEIGTEPYRLLIGDANAELSFDIYKMGEEIPDSALGTYRPVLGEKIGEYSGGFDFSEKIVIADGDTQTVTPEIVLTLDNQLGIDILKLTNLNNEQLKTVLKGIVLVPREILSGDGLIFGFESRLSASRVVVYFGSSEVSLNLGSRESKSVCYFENTPSAALASQLSGTGHYNTTYVQSLGGAKVKIELPELNDFIKTKKGERIVINEAHISFVLEDGSVVNDKYRQPPRLLLYAIDSVTDKTANFEDLVDFSEGKTLNYGGRYTNGSYDFRFNRYLQRLVDDYRLRGVDNFKGFYLRVPNDSPVTPHRAVLNTDVSQQALKISVRYTKLN